MVDRKFQEFPLISLYPLRVRILSYGSKHFTYSSRHILDNRVSRSLLLKLQETNFWKLVDLTAHNPESHSRIANSRDSNSYNLDNSLVTKMGSIGPDPQSSEEFTPHLYPPFPEDTKPQVHLETLSLCKLLDGDENEQTRLYDICRTQGFFYLDFRDTLSECLPEDAESLERLSEQLFKLPMDVKLQHKWFARKQYSIIGYKPPSWGAVDEKKTPETAEFFNIGKDDILDNPTRTPTIPPDMCLEPYNRRLLTRFQTRCHRTGMDIMSILAEKMGLPSDVFEDKHRITEPSDDHVRMTRGPPRKTADLPEIQTPGHTDFGSVTLLFNWLGGLQVWSEPSRGNFHQVFDGAQPTDGHKAEWLWVKPKPGHAVVNLGDAAVKFSGGLLCSARHRVVPAPGEQGLWPRYSLVYFVRPEDNCKLKRIRGGKVPPLKEGEQEEELTSLEWVAKQAVMLRDGGDKGGKPDH